MSIPNLSSLCGATCRIALSFIGHCRSYLVDFIHLFSIRRYLLHRQLSVVLDPNDNSVTFDPPLVRRMRILDQSEAFIYTFRVCHKNHYYYAFALNPNGIDKDANIVSTVQIDDRNGDIGYECLCPSISMIYYDYGLPPTTPVRLTVKRSSTSGQTPIEYYRIIPPRRIASLANAMLDSVRKKDHMQSIINTNTEREQTRYNELRKEAYDRIKQSKQL